MKTCIISAILCLACLAADWPQFKRTPDRQGCNLAEQVTLPSKLCSWVDFGSPILGSPVVEAGKVYCMAENGLLACVDLALNKVLWHAHLGGQANECTPAVGNGKVYAGSTAGKFHVLDAATGSVIKEYAAGGMIFASPLLLSTGVYFGDYSGVFHALDLNGNPKWTYAAEFNIRHGAASARGRIVLVDGNTNLVWLEDSATYTREVRKVHRGLADNSSVTGWTNTPMIWRDSLFAAFSEAEMYYTEHDLLQYNFLTGAFIRNKGFGGIGGGGASVHATPSVDTATGGLFCATANGGFFAPGWGTVAVYSAYPLGLYAVNSSPAVIGNCVIFGSEVSHDTGGCAVHFMSKTSGNAYGGTQIWSYRPASNRPVSSSPAVSDGRAVIGSLDGCLYGFWNGTEATSPILADSQSTPVAERPASLPGAWTLSVFPNPASGGGVTLSVQGSAALLIYDASGRLVRKLDAANSARWDLADASGKRVSSGTYHVLARDRTGKMTRSFNLEVIR